MSTRASIHFCFPGETQPSAIIYRHGDGYPEGLGRCLRAFIKEVKDNLKDTRFTDPYYLAAKWVVYDARRMVEIQKDVNIVMNKITGEYTASSSAHYLNFLSIGIMMEDAGDIAYIYKVICDGNPTLLCQFPNGENVKIPD